MAIFEKENVSQDIGVLIYTLLESSMHCLTFHLGLSVRKMDGSVSMCIFKIFLQLFSFSGDSTLMRRENLCVPLSLRAMLVEVLSPGGPSKLDRSNGRDQPKGRALALQDRG